jgi:predicted metal-dependent HD superfamily phosphohydrolase
MYDDYTRAIRYEYKQYNDNDYCNGRIRALRKLLAAPLLYRTRDFQHMETIARAHANNEITSLQRQKLMA